MKLVKLVYIAHGWYLGITKNALIDENPEAWKYGPVIPTVYHEFKEYGKDPIKLETFVPDPDEVIESNVKEFLDKIWEVYGSFSAIELSEKTHELDTPWYKVWYDFIERKRTSSLGIFSSQIPDNLIKEHYQSKIRSNKAETAN